jgi:hypothetical protein
MGAVRDHSVLIACIGAGSAVVAAFAKPIVDYFSPGPAAAGPEVVAVAPVEPVTPTPALPAPVTPTPGGIEGAWKQYIVLQDQGEIYVGTFVVARSGGDYVVAPRTQTEGDSFQTSIGVFDVSYDGQRWTFNSNWGKGEVGNFALRRVSPTEFTGEIRIAGKFENNTKFVKIE